MKRKNNLFEKITDPDNIRIAHTNSRKGKTGYREVKVFDRNLEGGLIAVKDILENGYVVSKYRVRKINDRGKERILYILPYFPDRIIQHCIVQVLEPIFMSHYIRDTFQSIKGRGVHDCKRRVERVVLGSVNMYCLKIDIKSYYPSIDNEILKVFIRRVIKCKETIKLLDTIIDSQDGVPIGSYLSQHLGNFYLSYLDHYFKEVVGCKHYFRYCDDIVILHHNKEFLHSVRKELSEQLSLLKLEMKQNYQVFPLDKRGLDFVGYVFHPTHVKLRKSIKTNFKKCSLDNVHSYYGWVKHCSGKKLWRKVIKQKRARRNK